MTLNETFQAGPARELAAAIEAGNLAGIGELLKNGADPNASGAGGMTPLGWALYRKKLAAFKLLLESGGNPDTVLEDGVMSFLHLATLAPESAYLEELLKRGAIAPKVEAPHDHPLHVAAINRRHPHLEMLLESKVEVDPVNRHGNTPLYYSCRSGDMEGARLLLDAGADRDLENNYKVSPRKVARVNEQSEVLTLLETHGRLEKEREELGLTEETGETEGAADAGGQYSDPDSTEDPDTDPPDTGATPTA